MRGGNRARQGEGPPSSDSQTAKKRVEFSENLAIGPKGRTEISPKPYGMLERPYQSSVVKCNTPSWHVLVAVMLAVFYLHPLTNTRSKTIQKRRLRLFELAGGDDGDQRDDDRDSAASGSSSSPSLDLRGQVASHTGRATGVAATRRRAVTVGEDGVASLVDLQRLADGGGGGGGGAGAAAIIWAGAAKGALPLSAVTFQGESEEVWCGVEWVLVVVLVVGAVLAGVHGT